MSESKATRSSTTRKRKSPTHDPIASRSISVREQAWIEDEPDVDVRPVRKPTFVGRHDREANADRVLEAMPLGTLVEMEIEGEGHAVGVYVAGGTSMAYDGNDCGQWTPFALELRLLDDPSRVVMVPWPHLRQFTFLSPIHHKQYDDWVRTSQVCKEVPLASIMSTKELNEALEDPRKWLSDTCAHVFGPRFFFDLSRIHKANMVLIPPTRKYDFVRTKKGVTGASDCDGPRVRATWTLLQGRNYTKVPLDEAVRAIVPVHRWTAHEDTARALVIDLAVIQREPENAPIPTEQDNVRTPAPGEQDDVPTSTPEEKSGTDVPTSARRGRGRASVSAEQYPIHAPTETKQDGASAAPSNTVLDEFAATLDKSMALSLTESTVLLRQHRGALEVIRALIRREREVPLHEDLNHDTVVRVGCLALDLARKRLRVGPPVPDESCISGSHRESDSSDDEGESVSRAAERSALAQGLYGGHIRYNPNDGDKIRLALLVGIRLLFLGTLCPCATVVVTDRPDRWQSNRLGSMTTLLLGDNRDPNGGRNGNNGHTNNHHNGNDRNKNNNNPCLDGDASHRNEKISLVTDISTVHVMTRSNFRHFVRGTRTNQHGRTRLPIRLVLDLEPVGTPRWNHMLTAFQQHVSFVWALSTTSHPTELLVSEETRELEHSIRPPLVRLTLPSSCLAWLASKQTVISPLSPMTTIPPYPVALAPDVDTETVSSTRTTEQATRQETIPLHTVERKVGNTAKDHATSVVPTSFPKRMCMDARDLRVETLWDHKGHPLSLPYCMPSDWIDTLLATDQQLIDELQVWGEPPKFRQQYPLLTDHSFLTDTCAMDDEMGLSGALCADKECLGRRVCLDAERSTLSRVAGFCLCQLEDLDTCLMELVQETTQSVLDPLETKCGICLAPYCMPHVLLCRHVLCLKCLLEWHTINASCRECSEEMGERVSGAGHERMSEGPHRLKASCPHCRASFSLAQVTRPSLRDSPMRRMITYLRVLLDPDTPKPLMHHQRFATAMAQQRIKLLERSLSSKHPIHTRVLVLAPYEAKGNAPNITWATYDDLPALVHTTGPLWTRVVVTTRFPSIRRFDLLLDALLVKHPGCVLTWIHFDRPYVLDTIDSTPMECPLPTATVTL